MLLIFYYNWSTFDSTAHSDREWLMWTNHFLEKNSGIVVEAICSWDSTL